MLRFSHGHSGELDIEESSGGSEVLRDRIEMEEMNSRDRGGVELLHSLVIDDDKGGHMHALRL